MNDCTLPVTLRYVVVYLDTGGGAAPAPGSPIHRDWLHAAEQACRRRELGIADQFLFLCRSTCETDLMRESVEALGFTSAVVLPIEFDESELSDHFDDYCKAAGWLIEKWLRDQHPGAICHAGTEYDSALFWWIGVEHQQNLVEWPFEISEFADELPDTHFRRAATWLAILEEAVGLASYQQQNPAWLGEQQAANWAATLCAWLHGFEVVSENDFDAFDPTSIRHALRISDFFLGFEAARDSHQSLEDFAARHDSHVSESSDASLRLITRHRRGELQRALTAFFGNATSLLWTLYSAIWPRFSRRDREACNDLVIPGCILELPDILRMWEYVSGDREADD